MEGYNKTHNSVPCGSEEGIPKRPQAKGEICFRRPGASVTASHISKCPCGTYCQASCDRLQRFLPAPTLLGGLCPQGKPPTHTPQYGGCGRKWDIPDHSIQAPFYTKSQPWSLGFLFFVASGSFLPGTQRSWRIRTLSAGGVLGWVGC